MTCVLGVCVLSGMGEAKPMGGGGGIKAKSLCRYPPLPFEHGLVQSVNPSPF